MAIPSVLALEFDLRSMCRGRRPTSKNGAKLALDILAIGVPGITKESTMQEAHVDLIQWLAETRGIKVSDDEEEEDDDDARRQRDQNIFSCQTTAGYMRELGWWMGYYRSSKRKRDDADADTSVTTTAAVVDVAKVAKKKKSKKAACVNVESDDDYEREIRRKEDAVKAKKTIISKKGN